MWSTLATVLIFLAVFGTSYWYVDTSSVCPVPVFYNLGEVDERFGITQAEVREILEQSENVWEEAIGKNLFTYDERSAFTVNLIYDERQQLASTEEEWRLNLDVKEKESKRVVEQVKVLASDYEVKKNEYESERDSYDARLNEYNAKVESYNETGGAPASEFTKLQKEKSELTVQVARLTTLENDLNTRVAEIDALGIEGNQLIEAYNSDVQKYNEIYGNLDLYTQGDFQRDRINIYKFSNKAELTKVIVHEFGHALGIGHVEGESSLMYYLMAEQPDSVSLTAEDKEALISTCGAENGFSYEVRRIIRTALLYL
jgi:predicted Zn-dependent protease